MPNTSSDFADPQQRSIAQSVRTLKASLEGLSPEVCDSVRQHLSRLIEAGERQLQGLPPAAADPAVREPDAR